MPISSAENQLQAPILTIIDVLNITGKFKSMVTSIQGDLFGYG
jgi:hypothetical protein